MKGIKCPVCETKFIPDKSSMYTASKQSVLLGPISFYDCFDCPKCGHQIVAGERMKPVKEEGSEEVDKP